MRLLFSSQIPKPERVGRELPRMRVDATRKKPVAFWATGRKKRDETTDF